jgi:hypothetical protein
MWGAHFWDIPAFEEATKLALVGEDIEVIGAIPSSQENFNKAVIDFIADGDGAGKSIF